MKKIFFLLVLFFCAFAFSGVAKTVRVVTLKGLVFEGTLIELKAFEYVTLSVDGKTVMIPYNTMAYIDEINTAESTSAPAEKAVVAEVRSEPEVAPVEKADVAEVKPEQPIMPQPEVKKAEPQPVFAEVKPEKKAEPELEVKPEPAKIVEAKPVVEAAAPIQKAAVAEVKPAVKPEVKSEPMPEQKAAPKKAVSKMNGYKGFLLDRGNVVYLMGISEPANNDYESAALDVLKRLVERDGFWKMTDNPDEAHFILAAMLDLGGEPQLNISIASELSKGNEELGDMKCPEEMNDFRRSVWELYNKTVVALQEKIERNKVSKRIVRDFTVE